MVPVLLLVGCETTGEALRTGFGISGDIQKFKIPYSSEVMTECDREIVLEEFSMAPNAGINETVGAFNMGKFGEKDRSLIEYSLSSTLEQFNQGKPNTSEVRVYVHRYAMSYSNDECSILAIIDWCIEQDGVIVFDEAFYAAYYSGETFPFKFVTLGGSKDKINKAIVQHIAGRTFKLCCNYNVEHKEELIFDTPESALSILPESIDSSPIVSGGIIFGGLDGNTFYRDVLDFEKINWENL